MVMEASRIVGNKCFALSRHQHCVALGRWENEGGASRDVIQKPLNMFNRLTRHIVEISHPFKMPGLHRLYPAGSYEVTFSVSGVRK